MCIFIIIIVYLLPVFAALIHVFIFPVLPRYLWQDPNAGNARFHFPFSCHKSLRQYKRETKREAKAWRKYKDDLNEWLKYN